MRDPVLSTAAFPTARCEPCDKAVLTYLALDDSGDEHRHCVHCDNPVSAGLEWVGAEELEAWGYYFGAQPPRKAGSACGGCGSCATNQKH